MVRNEWQFKIPEMLKASIKKGMASISIHYNSNELPNGESSVIKTVSVQFRNDHSILNFNWIEDDENDFDTSLNIFLRANGVKIEDFK